MLPRLFSIRPNPWQSILFCALGLVLAAPLRLHAQARPFAHPDRIHYDGQCMTIDGKDLVIYSGSFHYFRCPRPLWAQRFAAIRNAGFNTVETYVAWNMQERQAPSSLDDFSKIDLKDVDDWLYMAEQAGLYVIIRPGPYICAEWERGGFPGWLLNFKAEHPLRQQGWFRSDDPAFVAWSKHWYKAVCPMLAPHQITYRAMIPTPALPSRLSPISLDLRRSNSGNSMRAANPSTSWTASLAASCCRT